MIKKMLTERGQALAEYAPIIPPMLLLSVVILIPLAENVNTIFCRMVNALEPERCQVVQAAPQEAPMPLEEACTTVPFEEGASFCSQHEDCTELPGLNEGNYASSGTIETFIIKAGQEYHVYDSGETTDGCYYVSIFANHVSWQRTGGGKDCKDISHTQVWNVPVCH